MVPTGTSKLREYLEALRDFFPDGGRLHYRGDWDLVLRHGREFTLTPWAEWAGHYQAGRKKECFRNAWWLAFEHPELTYCEGYAWSVGFPIHHAWCADAEGRVVDPTWRGTEDDADWEYLGIPFDLDFVSKAIHDRETYGVFDVALLENPLPAQALAT